MPIPSNRASFPEKRPRRHTPRSFTVARSVLAERKRAAHQVWPLKGLPPPCRLLTRQFFSKLVRCRLGCTQLRVHNDTPAWLEPHMGLANALKLLMS